MQENIVQMSNQVNEKWNNLTKRQKMQIGIGVVIIIIIISIASWMMRTKYQVLFSENIDPKTVSEVAKVLDENNIKYRAIEKSTNIEVDEKDYQKALMFTAASGVTEDEMSLEQLLNNDMSTTESEINIKSKAYLKQSLENTLVNIQGVEEARVELVIPEQKNAYLQSQVDSQASVFLTLSNTLSNKQCEGIATYIASSVPNLHKKDIVIIDSTGGTLYSGEDEVATSVNKQQEAKIAAEKDLKDKIKGLIGNMYDDVRISPNLILNFDQYQESQENYSNNDPNENRGTVKQESTSNSSSTNTNSGGMPGTDTNGGDIPTYQTDEDNTQKSKEDQKEIIYAPNKQNTVFTKNPGTIELDKSSLAVNLIKNKIYKEEEVDLQGGTWSEFKEQNREPVILTVSDSILTSIQKATGIENVVVNAYEQPIFLDEEVYEIDYKDWIPYIALVLLLLLGVGILVRFRKQDEVVEVEPELEVNDMLKEAKEEVASTLEEIEIKENLETKRHIDKFVDEKPEAVANLLRNWLSEEDWG